MSKNVKDFSVAHNEKIKNLSRTERAKAGVKRLVQEMEANKDDVNEPVGMASGIVDQNGQMIIDQDEDMDNDK